MHLWLYRYLAISFELITATGHGEVVIGPQYFDNITLILEEKGLQYSCILRKSQTIKSSFLNQIIK